MIRKFVPLHLRIWFAVWRATWRDFRRPVYFGRQYTLRRWRQAWHLNASLVETDPDGTIWFWPF